MKKDTTNQQNKQYLKKLKALYINGVLPLELL